MGRVGRYLTIAFFALASLAGLANAMNEMGNLETALQNSVAFADALWGFFGLFVAVGIWRRRPWTLTMAIAWAVTVTYTATVASFSFHDPAFSQEGTLIGTVAAGILASVVTALLAWAARMLSRMETPAPVTPVA